MRCLLDTHAFLWWLSDDANLGVGARGLIGNPEVEVYVSAATIGEIEAIVLVSCDAMLSQYGVDLVF